jgi:transposase
MLEKVRLERADRSQVRLEVVDLDSLVSPDDRVRSVWRFVSGLDLSELHEAIRSREGHPGRPAIDPAILLCLWLYATLEDVGSARELDRLTRSHLAYRWICGGVSVNYHTLSDFRVDHEAFLDRLLTHSVVALIEAGITTLEEVAQDGLRTRASAGAGSFRRRATLEAKLAAARERIERLKAELHADPAASNRRRAAAQARAAREAEQRAEAALAQLAQIEERRKRANKKRGKRAAAQKEARASLTDPEVRVIKMADGGFRPAYNLQLATDTASGAVVGVHVSNDTSDKGLVQPMVEDIQRRFSRLPQRWLADTGYASNDNAELLGSASPAGVEAYMPIPTGFGRPAKPPPPSRPAALAWHERMPTEPAKAVYKRRYLAEWVNAGARNRGLVKLTVRGSAKVRTVLLWQALTHNLLRLMSHQDGPLPAKA